MIFESIFLFVFCFILAFLEVQIEGKDGWAVNLPTWRPEESKWYSRLYSHFMKGKALTGYHIGMFSLVLFVLHGFYFYSNSWTILGELQVISLFFFVSVVWDFLWFVLNPHFGWKKFSSIHIAWHSSWLGPWPYDYYVGVVAYWLLYTASYFYDWQSGAIEAMLLLFYIVILVAVTVVLRSFFDSFVKSKN